MPLDSRVRGNDANGTFPPSNAAKFPRYPSIAFLLFAPCG